MQTVALTIPATQSFDLGFKSNGMTRISDVTVPIHFYNRLKFSNEVLNTVINGDGLVQGQIISVAAPRGVGKSTLLMQLLDDMSVTNKVNCAYISNEECLEQLAYTANRINVTNIDVDTVADIDHIESIISSKKYTAIVIDSFPGLKALDIVSEKKRQEYAISKLIPSAKANKVSLFFIMHFTKAGLEAGFKELYHAVDTCITITKPEDNHLHRVIDVTKNRMGSCATVTVTMTANGLDLSKEATCAVSEETSDTPRALKRKQDTEAIINVLTDTWSASLSDFLETGIDIGRIERLLAEMVTMGKVICTGGGKGTPKENKRYSLKG